MPKRQGRRNFLINPRFQLPYMGIMVATAMVTIGILYGANVYFFNDFADMGRSIGLPADHVFFQFLDEQHRTLNVIFGAFGAVAFCAMCLIGMFVSHRVAGPLHRLNRHMKDVASGGTDQDVTFRKGDFFPELAESMNGVMRRVRGEKPQPGEDHGEDRAA